MIKIILASESPRRKALLSQLNVPFEIIPSGIDESGIAEDEASPIEYVKKLSSAKAKFVKDSIKEPAIIIAADTIVALDGDILNKPEDEQSAFEMLKRLQGKQHSVYTGVCIIKSDGAEVEERSVQKQFVDNTRVSIRRLTDEEISAYIKTGEPFGKAGGYAIQECGSFIVEGINGDYNTVVGLPLVRVFLALKEMGVDLTSIWQPSSSS